MDVLKEIACEQIFAIKNNEHYIKLPVPKFYLVCKRKGFMFLIVYKM